MKILFMILLAVLAALIIFSLGLLVGVAIYMVREEQKHERY